MAPGMGFLERVLLSGALGSVVSAGCLAVAARLRGKGALQPVNAVSHWRHGEAAASVTRADLAHTGTGFATHVAATLFWAALLEWRLGRRRTTALPVLRGAVLRGPVLREAVLVSAVAAVVDYTATPKRFTPGWEFVLPPRWMASAYVGMASGFALGATLARRG